MTIAAVFTDSASFNAALSQSPTIETFDSVFSGTVIPDGDSFGDIFKVVKDKLNKPILFTEFGADAFNAIEKEEGIKRVLNNFYRLTKQLRNPTAPSI